MRWYLMAVLVTGCLSSPNPAAVDSGGSDRDAAGADSGSRTDAMDVDPGTTFPPVAASVIVSRGRVDDLNLDGIDDLILASAATTVSTCCWASAPAASPSTITFSRPAPDRPSP